MNVRRVLRWLGVLVAVVVVLVLLAAAVLWGCLRASLAQLDGRRHLPGLDGPVRVERDALGVPTIHATNRRDAARALGFLHAQERFFQMDLNRRAGAGELSELVGPATLDSDRAQRIHRPRARAKQAVHEMTGDERALLEAYTEGVNSGLAALKVRPPEYLALRLAPAPWQVEDTCLVAYAMFGDLHDISGYDDYHESVLHRALSPAALAFFDAPDVAWGAALDGSTMPRPPIPAPEDFSAEDSRFPATFAAAEPNGTLETADDSRVGLQRRRIEGLGSNNWAVDGRHTATGAAIVANDMHLGISVPNTWFRARLVYQDPELGQQEVTGVTLPGTPVVVSGSNGHIAWGNTFSCLDITDLVTLEFDPANPRRYRTPSAWRELEEFSESIAVRGSTNVAVKVDETIWGPVVNRGGERYALACTLHEPQAFNLGLIALERARDVDAALHRANLAGTPVNNFVVGDKAGHIGYSLLGRLPNRVGFDGSVPCSWADGSKRWEGLLPPERYPRVINPASGALWSANNRILGTPEYLALHVTSPDNGARAGQIRDALVGSDKTSESALWAIYCDDRALFLERWQELMLSVLARGIGTNSVWLEAKGFVASWGGRAAVDSQGYRLVRGFRTYALQLLLEPVNQRLAKYDKAMRIYPEEAAWAMIEKRPRHLLDPKFKSYDELLGRAVELLLADFKGRGMPLAKATWGERNHLGARHPLSRVVPWLGRWLDMPDVAVSGDHQMPKVHGPGFGVSERMIVSPGHEANALFNMPCGQSGHFLSPFYRAEMDAWLQVQPRPFLPGATKYQLELHP